MKTVLASSSPRRRELMATAGLDFEVDAQNTAEIPEGNSPAEVVCSLARQKCAAVAARRPEDCVIGADTVVALEGSILGKPRDEEDARRMLRLLSGREHEVYTGVCISLNGRIEIFYESTKVRFFELTAAEIDGYVATGEPMDKAGAYGIQGLGCTLVERIEGDYFNIVGLPVAKLARRLRSLLA